MAAFERYKDAYPNARLTRSDSGVLEVAFHTSGGKLIFNGHTHEQFTDLFHQVGEDRDNRVVILTGTGDAFMDAIEPDGFDFFTPQGYDKIFREGRKILMNILDVDVPMIAALNGPVLLHSEYVLLCDVVLATPDTVFQDVPHAAFGIAPKLPSRSPGGSSMDRPPFATAVSWNARTCSSELHLNPMVPPFADVATSSLIGSVTQKVLPSCR